MRSVAVGGYLSAFAHGIPSVNIVHIPVAVVIHTRHTVQFRLVHPHVGRQVGMVPLHAAVHDSHNHGRVSRRGLPRLEQVDIGTLYGTSDGTFVVVMPLLRQPRVVERLVRRPCRTDCRRSVHHLPRNTAPIVQRHYPIDGLDMRYAGKRRDAVLGTRHGHILIETDVVPQMKPIPAAAFGKPAAVAETAPYFGGTERSGGPVQFRIARIGLTARKHPHLERCRILLQLYPYPAADNRPVVGHCFRFPAGTDSGVRRRLPDTRQCGQRNHSQKQIFIIHRNAKL